MFLAHLNIAVRHLWQNRLYTGINLIGLATGITCLLFAILYWKDEHGYDRFHTASPHLYRVTTTVTNTEGKQTTAGGTGQVQGPTFKAEVPEVVQYSRLFGGDIFTAVSAGAKTLTMRPLFADTSFFSVFSFRLLQGNASSALKSTASVVVTERTAKKFFNRTNVVGEVLELKDDPSFERLGKPLVITGVVSDPPLNSSIQFDLLLPFSFLTLSFEDTNWLNAYLGTFVVLRPGADLQQVVQTFNRIYQRYGSRQVGQNEFNIYGFDPKIRYGLQPITDIHLQPLDMLTGNNESGVINGSNPVYSYIFMGIALFVLLMAGINIINSTVGDSLRRAKEVGIRKIMGSSRAQIIRLFLTESAILCVLALLLSIGLLQAGLPWFNELSGKSLVAADGLDPVFLGYVLLSLVFIVLLSGLYPAAKLSRFKAAEVLYNKQKLAGRHLVGRSLVVLQFALAVFLLIASMVYYRQMQFIRTKHLGYNPAGVLRTAIGGARNQEATMRVLKRELLKEPSITQVSFGDDGYKEQVKTDGRSFEVLYKNIDEAFLATLEIPLKQGRNLSPQFATDAEDGVLVNETFVKVSGLDNPLGKRIKVSTDDSTFKTVRGVVQDVHFGSLREPIRPAVFFMKKVPDGGMWVRFKTDQQPAAMAAVERLYKLALPGIAYDYQFVDELNARQYLQESRWQKIISIATLISFIVCCLGLFSLAHLSAQQRIKEIGIRKTLGASVTSMVALLSGSFLKLVLLAVVVAIPASWIVMHRWLQDFAYRAELNLLLFLGAGLVSVLVAFAAISVQTIKAANTDPATCLRNE